MPSKSDEPLWFNKLKERLCMLSGGKQFLLISLLLQVFGTGCDQSNSISSGNQSTISQNPLQGKSDRPSDDDGGLPGYSLTCNTVQWPRGENFEGQTDCRLAADKKKAKLKDRFDFYEWGFPQTEGVNVAIKELAASANDHVSYQFSGDSRAKVNAAIAGAAFTLSYQKKGENKKRSVSAKGFKANDPEFKESLQLLKPYRYFKLVLDSASNGDDKGVWIEDIRLRSNQTWHKGFINPDNRGTIDGRNVRISGSEDSDPDPLYTAFRGIELGNAWSAGACELNGIENDCESVFLTIDFLGTPMVIDGIQINAGDTAFEPGPRWSVDAFHIKVSDDGVAWRVIPGSIFEGVDTNDLTSFVW